MINQIPFVQRTSQLCPRRGYSTALSARYDGWAGLYDEQPTHINATEISANKNFFIAIEFIMNYSCKSI